MINWSVPTAVMRTPAIAGPMSRAALTEALLSATALASDSRPTISMTNDIRVGMSTADAMPLVDRLPRD